MWLTSLGVNAQTADEIPEQIPDQTFDQAPPSSASSDQITEEIIVDGSDLPIWMIRKLEPVRSKISGWVDSSTRSLDSYFGTDEFLDVDNNSYLRISDEFEWMDSEGIKNSLGTRFKVDLPTTKERLKLVFESNPEETQIESEDRNRRTANRDLEETKNQTVIGLERVSNKNARENWQNRINGGLKLRIPLDPYLRFTSERIWDNESSLWTFESYNRISWFNSDGYSVRTRWQSTRVMSAKDSIRFTTQFQWREEKDTLEFAQTAEYNQVLGDRSVIRYALIGEGKGGSHPRMEDYYAQVLFRRDLHDETVYADFVPELHFAREDNFEPRWAVILRIEFYFRADFVNQSRSDKQRYSGEQ